jgi:hypothetical protein
MTCVRRHDGLFFSPPLLQSPDRVLYYAPNLLTSRFPLLGITRVQNACLVGASPSRSEWTTEPSAIVMRMAACRGGRLLRYHPRTILLRTSSRRGRRPGVPWSIVMEILGPG